MPVHPSQFPGGINALSRELRALRAQVNALRNKAFRVPVLDTDPDSDDPTNLWLFADGRLRGRMPDGSIQEWTNDQDARVTPYVPTIVAGADPDMTLWLHSGTGQLRARLSDGTVQFFAPTAAGSGPGASTFPPPQGSATSAVAKPADPDLATFSKTYDATFTRTFASDNNTVVSNSLLIAGDDGSGNGNMRAMVGFGTQPGVDVAGGDVRKVELLLTMMDANVRSGVVVRLGTHDEAAAPSSFQLIRSDVSLRRWKPGESRWRTVDPAPVGADLETGDFCGFSILQPSSSPLHYAKAAGIGAGPAAPQLRVTWVE